MSTYKKKLIEVALPLEDINRESVKQKTGRPKTGYPTTLHKYWAQRSIATARAAIWSSLVDDPSSHPEKFPTADLQKKERLRRFDILRKLILWESTADASLWDEAERLQKKTVGDLCHHSLIHSLDRAQYHLKHSVWACLRMLLI